jgi:hypothetical protein
MLRFMRMDRQLHMRQTVHLTLFAKARQIAAACNAASPDHSMPVQVQCTMVQVR